MLYRAERIELRLLPRQERRKYLTRTGDHSTDASLTVVLTVFASSEDWAVKFFGYFAMKFTGNTKF